MDRATKSLVDVGENLRKKERESLYEWGRVNREEWKKPDLMRESDVTSESVAEHMTC